MARSKLELYEEVLRALAKKPLTIDGIAYECNMDCIVLRQRLDFLSKNGLIQEQEYKNKTVFALTKRGIAIFKTLTITKRLEKLQTTSKKLNNALQMLPALSEFGEKKPKRTRRNENY
jgi:predicted transcriptional regulator